MLCARFQSRICLQRISVANSELDTERVLTGELRPVGVDGSDDLNKRGTIYITKPAKHTLRYLMRIEHAEVIQYKTLQRSGDRENGGGLPLALDGDICAVSCFNTCHFRAAIFHTADKSDLLSCTSVDERAELAARSGVVGAEGDGVDCG